MSVTTRSMWALLLTVGCASGTPPEAYETEPVGLEREVETDSYAQFLRNRGPHFECDDRLAGEQDGATYEFGTVEGSDELVVGIADPSGPCRYRIGVVSAPGSERPGIDLVPLPPATYLSVAGARAGGRLVLAVNSVDVVFGATNSTGARDSEAVANYHVGVMQRDDAAGGAWSALETLITHSSSAIWLDRVEPSGDGFAVHYALDSLHEQLFVADSALRDRDDGFYTRTFRYSDVGLTVLSQASLTQRYGNELLADMPGMM